MSAPTLIDGIALACPDCGTTDSLASLEEEIRQQDVDQIVLTPDGDREAEGWGYTDTWGEPLTETVGVRCRACSWYDVPREADNAEPEPDPYAGLVPTNDSGWRLVAPGPVIASCRPTSLQEAWELLPGYPAGSRVRHVSVLADVPAVTA